jgi:phosphoglycolate phosphatase
MNLHNIKAILFDKDGTLVDFEKTWFKASHEILVIFSNGNSQKLAALEAVAHWDAKQKRFLPSSPILAGATADYVPLLAKAINIECTPEFLNEFDRLSIEKGYENTAPIGEPHVVLAALKQQGYILGVATNGPEKLAHMHNEKLGITHLLSFTCGYDSGFGRKPKGGMARAFSRHIGLECHEIAVVGDTLHDIHMAHDAGCLAIGVASGLTPHAVLAKEADMMIGCLEDLLRL